MKTSPAACDLEAAAATAAQQPQAPARAAKKVTQEEVADPRLRSPFVRTVYAILSLQFALTSAIAATAYFVQRFFADGPPAAVVPLFVVVLLSPAIVCEAVFPKLEDGEKRPRNLVLIALVTVCCSLTLVLSAFTTVETDIAFLQAAILIVLGLTLCITWAAKRDLKYDHSNTFAALLISIIVPLVYTIVATPFPLKMVGITICGFLVTLVLSGFYVVTCESCDVAFSTTTATTMYNGGGDGSEDNGDNHRV